MLDEVNPQAVVAFGSIAEHLPVVEAAARHSRHGREATGLQRGGRRQDGGAGEAPV
jgi:hypothetical protein